jgi:hypothetical protein
MHALPVLLIPAKLALLVPGTGINDTKTKLGSFFIHTVLVDINATDDE